MSDLITPTNLKLKKDEKLSIDWSDGTHSEFTIAMLRKFCPCASCKELRQQMSRSRLTVLPPGTRSGPVIVEKAEMVGNYALRLTWSDGHATGIYSFSYLRELAG